MNDRCVLWSLALALCGAAVVMIGTRLVGGNDLLPPPLLDVRSEPHAVLYWEFHESGWGPQDAAALATRTINIIRGVPVEPFAASQQTAEGATLLDPDSEPLAIFYWAFLDSGHSPEVAANHARRLRRRVLGIEPEDPEVAQSSGASFTVIQVYPVRIVFCENGQRLTHRGYIDAPCWETTVGDCPIAAPKCRAGEAPWLTNELACEDFPCSWVTVREVTEVSEDTETVDCGCFEDVDCEGLEPPVCCHHFYGCGGPGNPCPECE